MTESPESPAQSGKRAVTARPLPTIYDVARDVGVSPSTVSRALHKPGRVNQATARRVKEAADRLGYRSTPSAQALSTGRTNTIGLLISDITNPVFFDFVRGVEERLADSEYRLLLAESQESSSRESRNADGLIPSVDGLILVASRLTDEQIHALAATKPVVVANRRVEGIMSVTPSFGTSIAQCLDRLHELGHSRLSYIAGPSTSWMNAQRWDVAMNEALARGMSIVEIHAESPTDEGGAATLDRVRASGTTAVLAYNDMLAIGLMRACRQAGVRVPEDLSIIGFDDIYAADMLTPSLTTFHSPLRALGRESIDQLVAVFEGREREGAADRIARFVERGSIGPAAHRS